MLLITCICTATMFSLASTAYGLDDWERSFTSFRHDGAEKTAPMNAGLALPVEAPSLNVVTVDGKEISSNSLKGKAYIVNFFATWCPACISEIPDMVKLQKIYGSKDFTFIGISTDDNEQKVRNFMKQNKINYPVVMNIQPSGFGYRTHDAKGNRLGNAYCWFVDGGHFKAIPTTFVIDASGQLTEYWVGGKRFAVFEQAIRGAISPK